MGENQYYFETRKYRCLDYLHRQCDALYLTMCGMEHCVPGKSYGPASRSGYHLHVILAGEGSLEVNGRHTELHSGQIFLEKPGEITHYFAHKDRPWAYCWVTFDGEKAGYYMEQAGFGAGVNVRNCYVNINDFYNLANDLLSKPGLNLANDLRRLGLLHQFVGLAIESYSQSANGHRNTESSPESYVDYALDLIRSNYSNIKVTDISDYIGINRSYLTSIFKRRMGVSPQAYLIRLRLCKSAHLLTTTELSIQEIAQEVGYENPLTFSKMFKNAYGVSPKHYRTQPEEERIVLDEPDIP